jgi:Coatomer WD associated region
LDRAQREPHSQVDRLISLTGCARAQVALLSKHAIIVADAKLKSSCTVHETIRVKSAAWSDSGVLLYTTLNHIKYCLPGGDSGIVRTLEQPVYVVTVAGDKIHALDRDGKTCTIQARFQCIACWCSRAVEGSQHAPAPCWRAQAGAQPSMVWRQTKCSLCVSTHAGWCCLLPSSAAVLWQDGRQALGCCPAVNRNAGLTVLQPKASCPGPACC